MKKAAAMGFRASSVLKKASTVEPRRSGDAPFRCVHGAWRSIDDTQSPDDGGRRFDDGSFGVESGPRAADRRAGKTKPSRWARVCRRGVSLLGCPDGYDRAFSIGGTAAVGAAGAKFDAKCSWSRGAI